MSNEPHPNDAAELASSETPEPTVLERSRPPEKMAREKIECNACPVLCQITEGRSGACDRYANVAGVLTRVDPVLLMRRAPPGEATGARASGVVEFAGPDSTWDGDIVGGEVFVTGVGAGTTYPDYKPAPFIVSSRVDGVDTVTVVTEGSSATAASA